MDNNEAGIDRLIVQLERILLRVVKEAIQSARSRDYSDGRGDIHRCFLRLRDSVSWTKKVIEYCNIYSIAIVLYKNAMTIYDLHNACSNIKTAELFLRSNSSASVYVALTACFALKY